jgi:putative ABC transport system ATP-binding protein
MGEQQTLINVTNLVKRYSNSGGSLTALDRVSLSVVPGELVAIVGPTGSGKTTLLNLIAGLDDPDAGDVFLLGERVNTLSEDRKADLRIQAIGMVYQNINLFPGFTVADNIGLPLRLMSRPPFDAHRRANQLLDEFRLSHLAGRYPDELSRGERQLVAIARAMAVDPPVLLLDEPTANLDSATGRRIVNYLRTLANTGSYGIVLATHDLRSASQADRVLSLRDGRIIKETRLEPGRSNLSILAELV